MIKKVLLLGSGGLKIGQAGEFDYSGSQCIKALKEEGIKTILVNPNIATVQTDKGLADQVYLLPLNLETVKKIIADERPDGILLGFGGQTALNLGMELDEAGILEEFSVKVLGTPVSVIKTTEDRQLFKDALDEIEVHTAHSYAATTIDEAIKAADKVGYPLMIRSGYSLGGQGSGIIKNEKELKSRCREALSCAPQVLIEEYLMGWKEIEYEVVRDSEDQTITICNMENFDPMGVHTGESIVIAPSQTLNNQEYHSLREIAIKVVRHLGIVGECNIQYALHPTNGEYRVIEVNARLSRSSALASKATGYPLAFVAAKLVLGHPLRSLKNQVTQKTSAFFEPALDYVVVKIPRWDMQKFKSSQRTIGSEMKSVGEVMAIGRSFPEALQKAVQMLNIGAKGLSHYPEEIENPLQEIREPTDRRLFAIYKMLMKGTSVEELHALSHIDPWFLSQLETIARVEKALSQGPLDTILLRYSKQCGFSDAQIGSLRKCDEEEIRKRRKKEGILPTVKQIDTLAGEFSAETNYLYMTYHGAEHDVEPSAKEPVVVIGSGPYCIGSSVEFDWCAVNTLRSLRRYGEMTIMINANPETVSTDYDESDRLYFEELSLERVRDIADFEAARGIVVSVGGQIANNLALPLANKGYSLLGTAAETIDKAEDRQKFSSLLQQLDIDQPKWRAAETIEEAKAFATEVGFPVLLRPSYVLSGAAMNVVQNEAELKTYLKEATRLSRGHPVVVSQFITGAKELEIDGIADKGKIVIQAIAEHIENAGVHSGDATIVLPPQRLYLETIRRAKQICRKLIQALNLTGPFNLQLIAKENELKVIECNVRASRSFPFVSKVTHHHLIDIFVQVLLGRHKPQDYETLELDRVGVKTPQFSYNRLKGADPVAQVEMASTGEVACIGDSLEEAFYQSWLSTGQKIRGKRLCISLTGGLKGKFLEPLKILDEKGWQLYATEKTHEFLARRGVASRCLFKANECYEPNITTAIAKREIDLIISIPSDHKTSTKTDGYLIRRLAIDHDVPLITNPHIAQLFLKCLIEFSEKSIPVKSYTDFVLQGGDRVSCTH